MAHEHYVTVVQESLAEKFKCPLPFNSKNMVSRTSVVHTQTYWQPLCNSKHSVHIRFRQDLDILYGKQNIKYSSNMLEISLKCNLDLARNIFNMNILSYIHMQLEIASCLKFIRTKSNDSNCFLWYDDKINQILLWSNSFYL